MLFKSVLLALAGAVVAAGAAGGEARAAAAAGGSAADDAVLVIVAQRPGTLEPSALRGALQLNGSLPAVREHVVAFAAAELGVGAECIAAVHEWEHAWGDWGAPLAPGGGVRPGSKILLAREPHCGAGGVGPAPGPPPRLAPGEHSGTASARPRPHALAAAQEARRRMLAQAAAAQAPLPSPALPSGPQPMGPKPRRQLDNELYNKLMEGYQRDVVPPSVGPIPVGISITFYQINAVDLYSGRLSISVWFSLYWKDSRLTWDPKEYNGTSTIFFGNPQQGDVGVWIPDVVVWNSAQAMTTTLGMQAVRASFDGSMFWSRDGTIEVTCTFTGLQAYPYGTYTCDAEFGSWNFGMASMMLHPEGAGAVIEVAKTSVALGGYTFREYTLTNVTVREQRYDEFVGWEGEGEWNNVIYTVRFMRASDIYSLKILVPQVMLTLISFSTMWLSPSCGERLSLAVTIPLAVAVYDLLVFNSLPISNKITFVGAVGVVCFLSSMIVLIENAVVVQLWHLSEPHFASNLRLLYSTIIAWREQSVWTGVLEVVASSKTNAVQATLKAAAEAKARQNSFDTSPAKVASATVRTLLRKSLSAGLGNRSGGASAAAPAAAGNADRRTVAASSLASPPGSRPESAQPSPGGALGRSRSGWDTLLKEVGDSPNPTSPTGKQEHAAVAMAAAADGAEQARLDGGLTPEHLRLSLERILDDRSHANAHLRRCIARAVRVFGMDTLVARLARVCGADESSMPDHAVEAALADVRLRLAADFNKRWQLLASLIDQIFRWALTVGYVLTMILIGVLLGGS